MTLKEIKAKIASEEYDFLRTNEHLGDNIILLTVSGSHSYGLEHEGSDLDIRGVATNKATDILTMNDFSHVTSERTDSTIYSLDKLVRMLCNANPNVLEMLGTLPTHRLVVSKAGAGLIALQQHFLSKKVANAFGGFAKSQLHQIDAKLRSNMDESVKKRICKQMMHYCRVMLMGIEVLETGEVNTYRTAEERKFLMSIRNGKMINDDGKPTGVFNEYAELLEYRLRSALCHTALPDEPNRKLITEFLVDTNANVCRQALDNTLVCRQ